MIQRSQIAFLLLFSLFCGRAFARDSYDMEEVYQAIDVDYGTVALTTIGEVEEVELILVPTKIDAGTYQVTVTRKSKDLYRVDGTNLYIKTRYCYEYAYSQKAIIDLQLPYGYSKGVIIFLD